MQDTAWLNRMMATTAHGEEAWLSSDQPSCFGQQSCLCRAAVASWEVIQTPSPLHHRPDLITFHACLFTNLQPHRQDFPDPTFFQTVNSQTPSPLRSIIPPKSLEHQRDQNPSISRCSETKHPLPTSDHLMGGSNTVGKDNPFSRRPCDHLHST